MALYKRKCSIVNSNCVVTGGTANFEFAFDIEVGKYFYYNEKCWVVDEETDTAQLSVTNIPVYADCQTCINLNDVKDTPETSEKNITTKRYDYGVKLRNCFWGEGDDPTYKFYPIGSEEEFIFECATSKFTPNVEC